MESGLTSSLNYADATFAGNMAYAEKQYVQAVAEARRDHAVDTALA